MLLNPHSVRSFFFSSILPERENKISICMKHEMKGMVKQFYKSKSFAKCLTKFSKCFDISRYSNIKCNGYCRNYCNN